LIAHFITNFESRGGAEGLLIKHLSTVSGQNIILISLMNISSNLAKQLPESIRLFALNSNSAITMALSAIKLSKILKENRVTSMICWMYYANIVGALSRVFDTSLNVIWNVRHSLDDLPGENYTTRFAIRLGQLFSWRASSVVFCAMRSLDQHVAINYCDSKKAVYIPNGFIFSDKLKNKKRNTQNKTVVIGSAGRFHPSKDYPTLFNAIKIIQDAGLPFELRLAGRDMIAENKSLVSLIDKTGLLPEKIKYLGFIEDVVEFYRSVDLFILSSKTEGFPNVLVEATYGGCICIASNVGDVAKIVSNSERIFTVGDYVSLADLVSKYFDLDMCAIEELSLKETEHVVSNFSIYTFNNRLMSLVKGIKLII
jgi:glycosyltransferase involved in cell wall biosynthesis